MGLRSRGLQGSCCIVNAHDLSAAGQTLWAYNALKTFCTGHLTVGWLIGQPAGQRQWGRGRTIYGWWAWRLGLLLRTSTKLAYRHAYWQLGRRDTVCLLSPRRPRPLMLSSRALVAVIDRKHVNAQSVRYWSAWKTTSAAITTTTTTAIIGICSKYAHRYLHVWAYTAGHIYASSLLFHQSNIQPYSTIHTFGNEIYILHAYDEAFYLFIIYKKFVIRNSAIPDSSKDKWQKRKNTKNANFYWLVRIVWVTSLLNELILTIFATNISLLALRRNYLKPSTYETSFILSKKHIL